MPVLFVSAQGTPDDPNIVVHIVQRGENLSHIASQYGLTIDRIARANGITNPSNITVGQRLLIPLNGQTINTLADLTPTVHIVQPGENLQGIATFYGLTVETLQAINDIPNANQLTVGQQIRLSTDAELSPEAVVALPQGVVPSASVTHTIQSGETLFSIATAYGVSVTDIQQANSIPDPTLIYSGQTLIIPNAQARAPQNLQNLPAFVTELTLNPLTLTEGQTGRLIVRTTGQATVSGSFLGRELVVIPLEGNTLHIAFLPVSIFTSTAVYPLHLDLAQSDGQSATIDLHVQINAGGYGSQSITIPADRVELLAPAVEQNETAILTNVTSRFTAQNYFYQSMSLPAAAAMNAAFGAVRSYNGGAYDHYHTGVDFAGAPGSPIYAAAAGQVVLADTLNIRGTTVVIDHGWGVFTVYCHMTERFVGLGDFVNSGQTIGTVGNTGRATGAHLHWELWVNNVNVDPMQWVRESFP